jgi:hypothetical protein
MTFTEYTIPIEHDFFLHGSEEPSDEQYRIARPLVYELAAKYGLIEIRARVMFDKEIGKLFLDLKITAFPWIDPNKVNLDLVHDDAIEIFKKLHKINGFWLRADKISIKTIEKTFNEIITTTGSIRKKSPVNPQKLN